MPKPADRWRRALRLAARLAILPALAAAYYRGTAPGQIGDFVIIIPGIVVLAGLLAVLACAAWWRRLVAPPAGGAALRRPWPARLATRRRRTHPRLQRMRRSRRNGAPGAGRLPRRAWPLPGGTRPGNAGNPLPAALRQQPAGLHGERQHLHPVFRRRAGQPSGDRVERIRRPQVDGERPARHAPAPGSTAPSIPLSHDIIFAILPTSPFACTSISIEPP